MCIRDSVKAIFAGTNENGEKLYAISRVPKLIEEEKPEEDTKPEDKKTTLDDWIIAQNSKDGYFTKEDAEAAAKLYLEKHPEFNSYRIMQGVNGNYYFVPEINYEDKEKPEDKKKQTLDEWQIEQNEKDGYFTKEDALRAGNLALDKAKLRGLYEVEVRKNAVQDRWFWRFVPVEKAEDKKPEDKKPEVKPNPEVKPTPDYTPAKPEDKTPAAPAENDKEVDKLIKDLNDSQKKINDLLEQNEKENAELNKKDKKEKDKKENKKAKKQAPAKQGTNPKTGVVGLGSVASLAAISMAGIVATRKRK